MELDSVIKALDTKKLITKNGVEYWMGRDIQAVLGYSKWDKFGAVIERAMMACESSGVRAENHFLRTGKMITGGHGAQLEKADYFLSRYACYLIAMNGDAAKPEIATAQTYFAVQTRKQELEEQLSDDQKRLLLRERVRNANKHLVIAARKAGVANFGIFHDSGYRGLYDMGLRAIKYKKRIPRNEDLLDRAGRAELAANEFRITQTEERLIGDQMKGERAASDTHFRVGREVRDTIKRLGGTLPEDLPPEENIRKLPIKSPTGKSASQETLPEGSDTTG